MFELTEKGHFVKTTLFYFLSYKHTAESSWKVCFGSFECTCVYILDSCWKPLSHGLQGTGSEWRLWSLAPWAPDPGSTTYFEVLSKLPTVFTCFFLCSSASYYCSSSACLRQHRISDGATFDSFLKIRINIKDKEPVTQSCSRDSLSNYCRAKSHCSFLVPFYQRKFSLSLFYT